MPIQLRCGNCGKQLQVRDEFAGRRVACPGCKTVLTAPGGLDPVPAPAAPPPRPSAPVPPPRPRPSDPIDLEPAEDDLDFPPPPPRTPAGTNPAPKGRREDIDVDEDDADHDPRPRRDRPRDREPLDGANPWAGFAGGCGMVKWGLVVELLAYGYLSALVWYAFQGLFENGAMPDPVKQNGPAVFLPFFGGLLLGTAMIWIGRIRMMSGPGGTGAGGVLGGAMLLTGIRGLALLAAVGLTLQAGTEWPKDADRDDKVKYLAMAFLAWFVAILPGFLAEVSVIPGVAIVGGAIPSLHLRKRAGRVTAILQLVAIVYFVLVGVSAAVVESNDLRDRVRDALPGRAAAGRVPNKADVTGAVTTLLVIGFLVQLVYTWLHASLYAAGQYAGRAGPDDPDDARDRDRDEPPARRPYRGR